MCQELYLDEEELLRKEDECWCSISEGYPEDIRQKAFAEIGQKMVEALHKKTEKIPDSGEVKVTLSLKLW